LGSNSQFKQEDNMKPTSLPRIAIAATVFSVLLLMALPKAHAETETVLYSFCSVGGAVCNDGQLPNGPLTIGWYGNFYGTTQDGGLYGDVFGLYPEPEGGCESGSNTGDGWCEFVLYSFCSVANCADGEQPSGNLAFLNGGINRPGNLYGTTYHGGANSNNVCEVIGSGFGSGCGTVFEIFPEPLSPPGCPSGTNGGNGWCEAVLYNFCSLSNCEDGTLPTGNLVADSAGNLYGTVGDGVFELSPNGSGGWNEAVIYQPTAGLHAGLAIDAAGVLYGATSGNVFKLSFSQNQWVAENIHSFNGPPDGSDPNGPPAIDSVGNVYGTTYAGGSKNHGTVWKLIPVTKGKNKGTYTETVLHSFTGAGAGEYPGGGVTLDSSGNIYSATTSGGRLECTLNVGCGTVFELAVSGTTYKYKLLWRFDGTDGGFPNSSPILGSSGNLYGVTPAWGANDSGTVYELTP
jgi:uncharacterized repeat protein (TIGR03803 family)